MCSVSRHTRLIPFSVGPSVPGSEPDLASDLGEGRVQIRVPHNEEIRTRSLESAWANQWVPRPLFTGDVLLWTPADTARDPMLIQQLRCLKIEGEAEVGIRCFCIGGSPDLLRDTSRSSNNALLRLNPTADPEMLAHPVLLAPNRAYAWLRARGRPGAVAWVHLVIKVSEWRRGPNAG